MKGGDNMKIMNHEKYQEMVRTMTEDELHYTMGDASAACLANPQGENAGYYADEVHYCGMELQRRAALLSGDGKKRVGKQKPAGKTIFQLMDERNEYGLGI